MKKLTVQEARDKIKRYCAWQERCHQEVRNKLYEYGLPGNDINEIVTDLITDGFLNEDRFAKAFAGGKFRIKKWGRLKIINELESRNISKNCIKSGLKEIADDDYDKTLRSLLEKKSDEVTAENVFVKRDLLAKYVIRKGYEPELVWSTLRELIPDKA